ncbi:MAG: hypothetical protein ACK40O_01350 [Allosphingosinicella sp.]
MLGKFKPVGFASAGLLLVGCGSAYDEPLDSPYRLVAADTMEQMMICSSVPEDDSVCEGIGLPFGTVFAAGANERYLVAAIRRPQVELGPPSSRRGPEEYYYIVRTPDEGQRGLPQKNIVGPHTAEEFERVRRELNLPGFSHQFAELR